MALAGSFFQQPCSIGHRHGLPQIHYALRPDTDRSLRRCRRTDAGAREWPEPTSVNDATRVATGCADSGEPAGDFASADSSSDAAIPQCYNATAAEFTVSCERGSECAADSERQSHTAYDHQRTEFTGCSAAGHRTAIAARGRYVGESARLLLAHGHSEVRMRAPRHFERRSARRRHDDTTQATLVA